MTSYSFHFYYFELFLFLGRKALTNLDIILKNRDKQSSTEEVCWAHKKQRHYFANKGPSGQGYGFSSGHVWMWELDYKKSWALKNWCLWTVVLEKTLGVPWTARRSNQSIPKEICPEYSLEGLMLKLKLQYFGHWMQITDSLEKALIQGKIEGRRRRGWTELNWTVIFCYFLCDFFIGSLVF